MADKEKPIKRHRWLSILTRTLSCALLLVVGMAVFNVLSMTKPEPKAADTAEELTQISVLPIKKQPVSRQWAGYGTADAMDTADVPARVGSTVVELPDEILAGNTVKKGQLLVRLDPSDFQRQVEAAEQNIKELRAQADQLDIEQSFLKQRLELEEKDEQVAQNELDRLKNLLKQNAAKQQDVDRAQTTLINASRVRLQTAEALQRMDLRRASLEARVSSLDATLRRARLDVERCEITSPITGVLQSVDIEIGEQVNVGMRIARVVDLTKMEVPVKLPSSVRPQVARGDSVQLYDTGSGDRHWEGRIARISPTDDQQTRTMYVYVELTQQANAENLLAPGQYVRGMVTASRPVARYVLPRRAVLADRVMLVEDGRIVSTRVDIDFSLQRTFPDSGLPDSQWVAVQGALSDGDLVVVNASGEVSDGQMVQARPVNDVVVKAPGKEPAG